MDDRIGVAFLGLAHSHIWPRADALQAIDDARLVAACEPDPERAAPFLQRYGVPNRPLDAILDDDRIQVVIVESWTHEMAELAVRALEAGKAVLLEKPGANDVATLRRVAVAEARTGGLVHVGYMLRQLPLVGWAAGILAEGVLGRVTAVRLHCSCPVEVATRPLQNQLRDMGGILTVFGCHILDLALHYFGLPGRVTGLVAKYDDLGTEHIFEDVAAATLEFDRLVGTLEVVGWEANEWLETWEVAAFGTEGSLFLGLLPEQYRLYLRSARGGFPAGWTAYRDTSFTPSFEVRPPEYVVPGPRQRPMFRRELEELLGRVRRGERTSQISARHGLNVMLVLDAIYRSSREGRAMTVDYWRRGGLA